VTGVGVSLAAVAAAAAIGGRTEQTARLFGAAETILQSAGASALLTGSAEFRDAIASGRATGDAVWDAAWRAGCLLSPEQAIGEALAVAEQDAPGQAASAAPPLAVALSRREREVLRLLADGRTNREIAEALVLSIRTVESHVFNTYAKIGARGRAEASAYAVRHGLA
jgi:non-specific serine/threonine protein kinase